jgi:hypothetical protein
MVFPHFKGSDHELLFWWKPNKHLSSLESIICHIEQTLWCKVCFPSQWFPNWRISFNKLMGTSWLPKMPSWIHKTCWNCGNRRFKNPPNFKTRWNSMLAPWNRLQKNTKPWLLIWQLIVGLWKQPRLIWWIYAMLVQSWVYHVFYPCCNLLMFWWKFPRPRMFLCVIILHMWKSINLIYTKCTLIKQFHFDPIFFLNS